MYYSVLYNYEHLSVKWESSISVRAADLYCSLQPNTACCIPAAYQEQRTEKKSHCLSLPYIYIYLYLLLFASLQTVNEIQSEAWEPHFGQQLGSEQRRRKERTRAVLTIYYFFWNDQRTGRKVRTRYKF